MCYLNLNLEQKKLSKISKFMLLFYTVLKLKLKLFLCKQLVKSVNKSFMFNSKAYLKHLTRNPNSEKHLTHFCC